MKRRSVSLLLAIALLCGSVVGCKPEEPAPEGEGQEVVELQKPEIPEGAISLTGNTTGYACLTVDQAWEENEDPARLSYFVLETAYNEQMPFSLACVIGDGEITGVVPDGVDLTSVIPSFQYIGNKVLYNGQEILSEQTAIDLSKEGTMTLVAADGTEHTVKVKIQNAYTGLPSVALTVEDLQYINSKTEFLNCTLYVGGGDSKCCPYAAEEPKIVTAQVRGRGNTSWSLDKKSYTINLDQATGLLDMPAARKWALVSNHEDKSLLRNYVAEYLSEAAGLQSVLDIRPVDLWYNGIYWGTYNLCERISIHEARVPITEQEDLTGVLAKDVAYLFEFDGHVNEVHDWQKRQWQRVGNYCYYDPVTDETFFQLALGEKWLTIKEPGHDQLTNDMANYVWSKVYQTQVALKKGDWEEIQKHMDVESFVRWYIVEEYMNNTDSSMHSSVFMYLDVGGKLTLGPTWDFDRSSDNCDYWNPGNDVDSLYESGAGWFKYMFECEEARALLKKEWTAFCDKIANIDEVVAGYAKMLDVSKTYNFQRWNILSQKVGANPRPVVRANTYEKQVEILVNFLVERRGEMNQFIQGLS